MLLILWLPTYQVGSLGMGSKHLLKGASIMNAMITMIAIAEITTMNFVISAGQLDAIKNIFIMQLQLVLAVVQ